MNSSTILLVEDNDDDIVLTQRAFRKANRANPVRTPRAAPEALDCLCGTGPHAGRDPADAPAVILLDLKLPKVDGLEVLRRLRADARTRLVRTVVLTSSREEQDLIR